MSADAVDVVVIGAGPVGENVADRVQRGGLRAMIVESGLVGGECSYAACIPSKALLRGPTVLDAARAVDGARQAVTGRLDAGATLARRTAFTHDWQDDGQAEWLEGAEIELARGHGRLVGEREVEIVATAGDAGSRVVHARHAVVVCTGTDPSIPPIDGLAAADPWTNRQATRADAAPRRLVVLGGGPVGCELATAWRALGSEDVTLVERGPHVLSRLEPMAGDAVGRALAGHGITVRTGTSATRVERDGRGGLGDHGDRGAVRVHLESDAGSAVVEADEVLVALGRTPRTKDLGLETVGLSPGSWLPAGDDGLVEGVGGGWLYATGDVTGTALLTHMGKYHARACGDAIVARAGGDLTGTPAPWSQWAATARHDAVTQVVYTSPPVAAVGLTETEARDRGLPVRTAEYDIGNVSGAALHADGYDGKAKIVVDADRRVVLGATFVGPDVDEMLHAATIAVVGEVTLDRLWHAVPAFPAISEVWLRLLETYGL
jgi:pyruvate/2-oxoglutarate dehydrogenase complex dihydrolipoamide dehydrogenase (E3) component